MRTIELNLAELESFGTPDEVREFPLGRLELVKTGEATVGRGTFQPGWHWAESVKSVAKTDSCEAGISNTRCPACCGCGWTTARNSTARRETW